jgi:hypothetical protein
MSKDLEKKLEKLFLHKEKVLTDNNLELLIRSVVKNDSLFEAKKEKREFVSLEQFYNFLPKMDINSLLGEKNTTAGQEARKQFNKMIGDIVKDSKSLEEKLKKVEIFCSKPPSSDESLSTVLNRIFFLKVFYQLLNEFSGIISGYLFESFVSALMDGRQINSSHDIDDVMLDEKTKQAINLKLLKDKNPVHGSIGLALKKFHNNKNSLLDFYVGYKLSGDQSSISFYHFTLNYNDFLIIPNVKNILRQAGISHIDLKNIDNPDVFTKVFNALKTFKKSTGEETQFEINHDEIKKFSKPIILKLQKTDLYNVLQLYNNVLNQDVRNAYKYLYLLSNNISLYYLEDDYDGVKDGITNATALKDTLSGIKDVKGK